MAAVPSSIGELTPAWLSAALSTPDEPVEVASVALSQVELGTGFLSTMARVSPTYASGEGPASVIVKLPTDADGARQVGELLNSWVREARFYSELVHDLDGAVDVPRCFHAAIDGNRAVVVLEDLSAGVMDEQLAGASIDDANAVVDALARLQSRWWGSRRHDLPAWMPGIHHDDSGVGLAASMRRNFGAFEERYESALPAESMRWTDTFIEDVPRWLRSLGDRPTTLAHADLHLGNIVADVEPERPVTLIDWQTAMVTGGVTDLTFFLGTALTPESRARHETDLVTRYTSRLREHGVAADELAHVGEDYVTSLMWWMAMLSNNLAHLAPPEELTRRELSSMVERLHQAALDHDAFNRARRQLS